MTDIITHRLVGYDRASGCVAIEYDVPDHLLELAKGVARVGADDPQAVLCYRLDDLQAHDLATAIGAKIDEKQLNFYLEGFAGAAVALDGDRSAGGSADAARLLAEVRTLREQQRQREWDGVSDAFQRIRVGWNKIRRRQIEGERQDAPRHNMIRFLGLRRSEIGFYSPFLRDLLDPFGTHGQGVLFLKSFLAVVSDTAHRARIPWNYQWQESAAELDVTDWSVLDEREKIDISVRSRSQSLLVYIEDKIDAKFTSNQLEGRYRERLEEKRQDYHHRLLVLLTCKDYPDPQAFKPDIHLTYEDDISPWISTILREPLPINVRGNLLQYQQSISLLSGDPPMANEELIELIAARRDNLSCAWEIARVIDQVGQLLRTRFWDSVHKNLLQELRDLTDTEMKSRWSVQISEEIRKDPLRSDGGIYISPNESPTLQLGVFQQGGNKVFYGVGFCSEQQYPLPPEAEALQALLPVEWTKKPDGWWLGYHETGYRIKEQPGEFLLNVAEDVLAVSQPMTDAVMTILRDHVKQVIAANNGLAYAARR